MVAQEGAGNLFPSMPNFRQINKLANKGKTRERKYKVYRSSRPDFLTETEVERFRSLGIKTIIDFRSHGEYGNAKGGKLVDAYFPVYKVKVPVKYQPDQKIEAEKLRGKTDHGETLGKHYLIDFYRMNYITAVFSRAPWYIRLFSVLCLLVDFVLMTGHKYFVRLFARNVLNLTGLAGQYRDMLTYSQASISAG